MGCCCNKQNTKKDESLLKIMIQRSISYIQRSSTFASNDLLKIKVNHLRDFKTIDQIMDEGDFIFMLPKEDFMVMGEFKEFKDIKYRLILVPISVGFLNVDDHYFISHCWSTPSNPDPNGVDYKSVLSDIGEQKFQSLWFDFSCIPQRPRSDHETKYFKKILRWLGGIIIDCAMEWRYSDLINKRAWVLLEIFIYLVPRLNVNPNIILPTEDNVMYLNDIKVILESEDPILTIKELGYTCTNGSDLHTIYKYISVIHSLHKLNCSAFAMMSLIRMFETASSGGWCDVQEGVTVDFKVGMVKVGNKSREIYVNEESN